MNYPQYEKFVMEFYEKEDEKYKKEIEGLKLYIFTDEKYQILIKKVNESLHNNTANLKEQSLNEFKYRLVMLADTDPDDKLGCSTLKEIKI